jgi:hypothetical protein
MPVPVLRSYKYRQNSDFWYLTGFAEPDSAVVLGKCALRLSCDTYAHPLLQKKILPLKDTK